MADPEEATCLGIPCPTEAGLRRSSFDGPYDRVLHAIKEGSRVRTCEPRAIRSERRAIKFALDAINFGLSPIKIGLSPINFGLAPIKIGLAPINFRLAAISVGICQGEIVCDLDYEHDSTAEVDMNVVMRDSSLVEVQGTGEQGVFDRKTLDALLDSAEAGISEVQAAQRAALGI